MARRRKRPYYGPTIHIDMSLLGDSVLCGAEMDPLHFRIGTEKSCATGSVYLNGSDMAAADKNNVPPCQKCIYVFRGEK